ncbi:MAG: dienelactone hydrolase family protein [Alphaproteobacteria bacterium]|nr:dienelactone hydrolase family protein [Alphaproteobacteria bacterium]
MKRDGNITTTGLTITCPDGFAMPGLLVLPGAPSGPLPGLLMITEPFGINAEMRRLAAAFAAAGHAVLVPDLVARKPWLACIRALMRDLHKGEGRGVDDLLAARATLAARPEVDAARLAVTGFCMGGGFALILAKSGLFQVAAPFYGQTPGRLDGACPVIANYGARDGLMKGHARHLQEEAIRLSIPHELHIHEGAGHAFMTLPPNRLLALLGPLSPAHAAYHPRAAAEAMARVLAFLENHL